MLDKISSEYINSALNEYNVSATIYPLLESTNKTAKKQALSGAESGTLIIAEQQTGGKGRLGRTFYSPDKSGVYFSLVLKDKCILKNSSLITTAAAVAVCRAIEAFGDKSPKIKWVNDIFIDGKKVCGILSEASFSGEENLDFVVLGIGINLYPPKDSFPKDIKDIAGTIFESEQVGIKNQLITEIIKNFFDIIVPDSIDFIDEYQNRMLLIGETVYYTQNGENKKAKVLGVDDDCRLKVLLDNGETKLLYSGEITIGSKNINQ